MREIRIKPKSVKTKAFIKATLISKEAKTILRHHYRGQQKFIKEQSDKSNKQLDTDKNPSNYAIERIENIAASNIKNISRYNRMPENNALKRATMHSKRKAQKKMLLDTMKITERVAKASFDLATKITFKLAQAVVASSKALISGLLTLGIPAIILVVLIGIITIAAVVSSPYGIFISAEVQDVGSISLSSIIAECNNEFAYKIEQIEEDSAYDVEEMEGELADWADVLAVFAVKTAGVDDNTAKDVVVFDEAKKELLKSVFWDMNSITSRIETTNVSENVTQKVLFIIIESKTSEQMVRTYNFSQRQQQILKTLLDNKSGLMSAVKSLAITDARVLDIINNIPASLSEERKQVVKLACSLVRKVNYFWGGKSSEIGWDDNWGKMMRVTSSGSASTGTIRPFGLDCSGFVAWVFINSKKDTSYGDIIGYGTQNQYSKCTPISWQDSEPGDLAFYRDLSHVGIVVGRDTNGDILVIQCASGYNNVVLTTNSGFELYSRPDIYR